MFERRSTFANPAPWFREALGIEETYSGVSVTPESSLRATAVFACVRVLSESIASLPLHVYRRNGEARERADDHPLYSVLHSRPNAMQTSFEFRQLLMVHMLLWGNAYVEITRNPRGEVTELWPLRPDRMTVRGSGGELEYLYASPGGGTINLPFRSVLHLKAISTDGVMGLSPITAARQSIGLSLAAERFGAGLFRNGVKASGVLNIPPGMGKVARESLEKSFTAAYGSAENAHKVIALEDGAKFVPLTIPPNDAQFLETRRFGVEDICRIFRVPPHMVAELSKANYSNVDAMDRAFVQHSLTPWLVSQEQAFSVRLLGPQSQSRYFVEHDLKGILRGDHESRMRSYQAGIYSGIYSPNDARRFENLNPREGGDIYLQPTNLAISPYNPAQPQPAQQEQGANE
jgi:HK97 family phage portal protein